MSIKFSDPKIIAVLNSKKYTPSVEQITSDLKGYITKSLKLVEMLKELGCGGDLTIDSLYEVLGDIDNIEKYGSTDGPVEENQ